MVLRGFCLSETSSQSCRAHGISGQILDKSPPIWQILGVEMPGGGSQIPSRWPCEYRLERRQLTRPCKSEADASLQCQMPGDLRLTDKSLLVTRCAVPADIGQLRTGPFMNPMRLHPNMRRDPPGEGSDHMQMDNTCFPAAPVGKAASIIF